MAWSRALLGGQSALFLSSLCHSVPSVFHPDSLFDHAQLPIDSLLQAKRNKLTAEQQVAKAWDAALVQRAVLRPSDIKGIDVLEKIRKFHDCLAPFRLSHEFLLKRMTPERRDTLRKEAEAELVAQLEGFGF